MDNKYFLLSIPPTLLISNILFPNQHSIHESSYTPTQQPLMMLWGHAVIKGSMCKPGLYTLPCIEPCPYDSICPLLHSHTSPAHSHSSIKHTFPPLVHRVCIHDSVLVKKPSDCSAGSTGTKHEQLNCGVGY